MAGELSLDLADADGAPLQVRGIDLRAAVEQVLFATLRSASGRSPGPRRAVQAALRRPGLVVRSLRRRPALDRADVLVLLLSAVHRRLFAMVGDELARDHPDLEVRMMTAGRAARDRRLADLPAIATQLGPREAVTLVRHPVSGREIARATREWPDRLGQETATSLRRVAADAILRLAAEALRLDAALATMRPRVVAVYDEIDAWGRLVTEIAPRHGARTVDLPHAEAVDVEAIRGAGYDVMAVYGSRAAGVLAAAGVARERIEIVGPAAFDRLVRATPAAAGRSPVVVLAAQYRGGRMTDPVRRGILDAAVAAAEAIDGSLVVKPHPVEAPDAWDDLLARAARGRRLDARVEREAELHDLLRGAALLVTGWSNSVYEAVLSGVPALTVHLLDGAPPMPFAQEGIAREARSAEEAAAQARNLVHDSVRASSLAVARRALEDHLGPLDGAAAARTAAVLARVVRHARADRPAGSIGPELA